MNRYGYVRCWTCVGNGLVQVVTKSGPWGCKICPDCKGSGADAEKTKKTI